MHNLYTGVKDLYLYDHSAYYKPLHKLSHYPSTFHFIIKYFRDSK